MATRVIEPERAVRGMARGEDGGTVFERDAEELGLASSGQYNLIAQGGREFISRGSAGVGRSMIAGDLVAFVLYGGHRMSLAPARVPPLIEGDSMPRGVGPCADRRVTGRSHGVGVIVVAIGEVCAALEK